MISASGALKQLKEGNDRFVSGNPLLESLANPERRSELQAGQEPFAIILGCSDSRVPSEIVFDCSLGHLFVIRVAGNIVAPSQIGSIEYATLQFGTRLVVVMGHTGCGAVSATINELRQPSEDRSPNLSAIVDRVRPAVEPLMDFGEEEAELLNRAVQANIHQSVAQLRAGSDILAGQVQGDGLEIVGAQYSLSTGRVEFL
jgi:carbonic anhydrase